MKYYLLPVVISLVFTACNDSKDSTQETMSANSTAVEQAVTKVEEKQPQIKEVVEPAPQTAQPAAQAEISGEVIFGKCKSCHGNSAEKHALGASKIIQGWDVAKIEAALHGYQKGTYGGAMKNVMAAQAKSLSNEEIKKVATYIHSL